MNLFMKKPKPESAQQSSTPVKGSLGNFPVPGQFLNANLGQAFNLLAQMQPESNADAFVDQLFDEGPVPTESLLSPTEQQSPATLAGTVPTSVLGQESRLSDSVLWQLHEEYYARMGVGAWDGTVPCFVTSSAFIAEAYAEMILSFLQDYEAHLNKDEPVYIVEMATGVGRFSHLLMRELEIKLAYFSKLKDLKIRYIMTDFTENNVNVWRQHEKFQPYLEKGMLDFAVFRPEDENTLNLLISGQTVSASRVKNPLIAIANYFFDTIRQDMFRMTGGVLQEGLVTLKRETKDSPEMMDESIRFDNIQTHYRYRDITPDNYYDVPEFNAVLKEYQSTVRNGTIIFPIGALRAIRNLQHLSGNNLVLLSSDKAYAAQEHMFLYNQHNFAVHGSFSYMVNYDAIGKYFNQMPQGQYFPATNWSVSLQTVCGLSVKQPAVRFERMKYYFDQYLNMANNISSLTRMLPNEPEGLGKLLAIVRTALGDPRAFCQVIPRILEYLPNATMEEKHDLVQLMEISWQKYFFFRGELNLPYWFAELYYNLNLQEKCLACLEEALNGYSEYAMEYYYLQGRCYEKLNQWQRAQQAYEQSLKLCPEYEQARYALEGLKCLVPGDTPEAA